MAEVFRPTYYVNPETGKRCKKSTPGAVKRKSKTWWTRFYLPNGQRPKVKLYRDRKASETRAAELERRGERLDAGFADPLDEHARRPLAEHLADFAGYLAAKGNTPAHVTRTQTRAQAALDGARCVKIADLQPSAILGFVDRLRKQGAGITTANHYLTAAKGFSRWLWRERRIDSDPLAGMAKLANVETDIRHARRELCADELRWLLETTRQSARGFRGLAGFDRFALYLTAAGTGFRRGELVSLTPASFDLAGDRPTARVEAAYSKNRKEARQPLPADLAAALRDYLYSKPTDAPVWPGTWAERAASMLRADLDEARTAWLQSVQDARQRGEMAQSDFLAYRDAAGLVIDFHALRHTYISRIVRSGATPKVAQELARHSTVQLTLGRYAHVGLYDLTSAVDALPALLPAGRDSATATGTDGGQISLGLNLGPRPAILGDFVRQAETEDSGMSQRENHGNAAENRTIPVAAENGPGRIRTCNPGIMSPLL